MLMSEDGNQAFSVPESMTNVNVIVTSTFTETLSSPQAKDRAVKTRSEPTTRLPRSKLKPLTFTFLSFYRLF